MFKLKKKILNILGNKNVNVIVNDLEGLATTWRPEIYKTLCYFLEIHVIKYMIEFFSVVCQKDIKEQKEV